MLCLAIVVVHEAFGTNDVTRAHVSRLTATFRSLGSVQGRAYSDIEAAHQLLIARPDCTGRVGVIGFCMGGGFALMTATRGFDAPSANYGMLPKDLEIALAGACPKRCCPNRCCLDLFDHARLELHLAKTLDLAVDVVVPHTLHQTDAANLGSDLHRVGAALDLEVFDHRDGVAVCENGTERVANNVVACRTVSRRICGGGRCPLVSAHRAGQKRPRLVGKFAGTLWARGQGLIHSSRIALMADAVAAQTSVRRRRYAGVGVSTQASVPLSALRHHESNIVTGAWRLCSVNR